jgi:hypothetical protein
MLERGNEGKRETWKNSVFEIAMCKFQKILVNKFSLAQSFTTGIGKRYWKEDYEAHLD